jgi:L-asparagine transporter-like permease
MQVAGLALIAALLITMGLDADWRLSWLVGLPWLVGLSVAYIFRSRFKAAA